MYAHLRVAWGGVGRRLRIHVPLRGPLAFAGRSPALARALAGAAAAFVAGSAGASALCSTEPPVQAPDGEQVDLTSFLAQFPQRGSSLLWGALSGEGKIEIARLWRSQRERSEPLAADEIPGSTKLTWQIRLGGGVCGHPGLLHGGLTAALLDEYIGWAAHMELSQHAFARGAPSMTANLNVDYRRPVPLNAEYRFECEVVRIVRQKKVYAEGRMLDSNGTVVAEATALYIVVYPK